MRSVAVALLGLVLVAADSPPTPRLILPELVDFVLWENFNYQHGVTVSDYLRADSTYRMGVWLTAWSRDGDPSTPEAQRRARFVHGVALLGDHGFGCLVGSPEDDARGMVAQTWWDTGKATGKPTHEGVIWKREFEKGTLTVFEAWDATFTPTIRGR